MEIAWDFWNKYYQVLSFSKGGEDNSNLLMFQLKKRSSGAMHYSGVQLQLPLKISQLCTQMITANSPAPYSLSCLHESHSTLVHAEKRRNDERGQSWKNLASSRKHVETKVEEMVDRKSDIKYSVSALKNYYWALKDRMINH